MGVDILHDRMLIVRDVNITLPPNLSSKEPDSSHPNWGLTVQL